jgi:uncharacterized repeat protein (TIGR03803 family)
LCAPRDEGYQGQSPWLVSFNGADGAQPVAGLIADSKGNLFGTTLSGGAQNSGTVFEVAKTDHGYASTPTVLVSFCSLPNCADGAQPQAGLIFDAKGNLFGTTSLGGANGNGTVFEIAKTDHGYASTPTVLVSFCSLPNCADGRLPEAPLIADAKGNLFGTTLFGGANDQGTVFEIAKTDHGYASTPTVLVSFCSLPNCVDGRLPLAPLIFDTKGNLFGTTTGGGAVTGIDGVGGGLGTVFEVAKTDHGYASTPTVLVSFCSLPNCADGAFPRAGLIVDAKGNLFSTTTAIGINPSLGVLGTVFEIVKTDHGYASTPTTLVSFCALGFPNCPDGAFPEGELIADSKGNLFSTTVAGGANGLGTVFEVTDTGFVIFAGTPGKPNCFGQSLQRWPGSMAASTPRQKPWAIQVCGHCKRQSWSFAKHSHARSFHSVAASAKSGFAGVPFIPRAEGPERVELPRSGARAGMTADGAPRPLPDGLPKVF